MRITRCLIDTELSPGAEIELPEAVRHHLIHVLRLKQDQMLTVFNGRDAAEALARLVQVDKKQALIKIESVTPVDRESPARLVLVQAVAKTEKMDFSIQKAVELGVSEIIPIYSERSTLLKGERLVKKLRHWQGVANSATEQCGRTLLTGIAEPLPLADYLTSWSGDNIKRLILDPGSNRTLWEITFDLTQAIHILIGPEGGFATSEIQQAEHSSVIPISLGPRILRTETAGMAALSILQSQIGDFA